MDVKEVADFKWDEEQDDSIAYISKQKLFVLRGKEAEEGIPCDGYICSFRGLVVRTVLLDSFLLPNSTADKRFIVDSEIKVKCQKRALLTEVALLRLDISTAEYAYVKMRDYCGLRFCERIMEIQDPHLKKAEIFIHLGRASDAEKVYIEQDRRDLAIDMYKRADEWLRVLRLVSISSNATDDKQRIEALTNVANYNKDRQRWKEAADHYELAGKSKELMECYIHLDDFYGLENLAKQLPDRHPLLPV
ncbi:WD repeat-containing protein 35 [Parelaphostrongylus tenuis]|uniref:WD repeat-containing protein 35 n=1 Tax=Parelaphostrongylus tenuis TaxID=148309 RepID=A0AAD5QUJ1_PARTN|nr:WD repeat-containing protein 35 [Parelaphostrongylus tenuis]